MNNRFKGLISKIKEVYGDVYRTYPITMILVNITTFMALIYCLIGDTGSNVSRRGFLLLSAISEELLDSILGAFTVPQVLF